MKNLMISIVSASDTVIATMSVDSGKKTKKLPRAKFTRNQLRRKIQERELSAEILEALADLHNPEQEPEDHFYDGDDELWDPYVEERWDHWRYGHGFTHYVGDRRWGDGWRYALENYREDQGDDREEDVFCSDFGGDDFDDGDYGDPCYLDRPSYYLDFGHDFGRTAQRDQRSLPDGYADDHVTLAHVLIAALEIRSAERRLDFGAVSDFMDEVGFATDEENEEVPQEYFEEPSLSGAAVYDRPRFSSERFVRLPGRKVRFKKNKEQRGGNRRAYYDYFTRQWVDGVGMVSCKNGDGSRRITKGKRSAECVASDFFRDKRNDWSYRDMTEALLEATEQDMAWEGKKKQNRRRRGEPKRPAALFKVTRVDESTASNARLRLGGLFFGVEDLNAHVRGVLLKKKV